MISVVAITKIPAPKGVGNKLLLNVKRYFVRTFDPGIRRARARRLAIIHNSNIPIIQIPVPGSGTKPTKSISQAFPTVLKSREVPTITFVDAKIKPVLLAITVRKPGVT